MRASLAIGVLVALGALAVPFLGARNAQAATVNITLYGDSGATNGWSFTTGAETNPGPTIYVNKSDNVVLQLWSDGGTHIFLLDYNDNNLTDPNEPVSQSFTTATSTILAFTANRAGTFNYICTIHTYAVMHGTFVVNNTGGPDVTPPTISALAANPSNAASGGAVNVTVTATDADSGMNNVTAHIVGPSYDQNLTMTQVGASGWYLQQNYTTNGTYTVTVWAQDVAGNFASAQTTFTIGGTTPPGTPADNTVLYALVGVVIIVLLLMVVAWMRRGSRSKEPPKK